MVQTVKDRATTGGGPFVVIGHSQGSMVTYQALMELGAELTVDLFVTIGSPLGLPQVTDVLHKWYGGTLPIPAGVKRWVNIAQNGDIVCLDQILANDYSAPGKPAAVDQRVEAIVWPPSKAHSASLYLSRRFTQGTVMEGLDRSRFQPVSPITVKRNLADSLDAHATARVPVLIELVDRHHPHFHNPAFAPEGTIPPSGTARPGGRRCPAAATTPTATAPTWRGHRRGTAGGGRPDGTETCWRFWCVDGSGAAQSVG